MSFNFIASVTIRSDFGAQEEEIRHNFHLFPFNMPCSSGARCHDHNFFIKQALSLSSVTLIKSLFSSSSLSAIRGVSSTFLRLLMFLLPILIPACNSSSPAFLMRRTMMTFCISVSSDHLSNKAQMILVSPFPEYMLLNGLRRLRNVHL